jgi:hypothetical protein
MAVSVIAGKCHCAWKIGYSGDGALAAKVSRLS